jgi:hypothetical protein
MSETKKSEIAACQSFVESYNNLKKTNFELDDKRVVKDKPDCLVRDKISGISIGIEISHLFYDSKEAKMLLGRSSDKIHGLMNSTAVLQTLNERLKKKCTQAEKYEFEGKMFLVVRVASPIFDKSTFDRFEDDIIVPSNVFDQIWLLFFDFREQEWGELKQLKYHQ